MKVLVVAALPREASRSSICRSRSDRKKPLQVNLGRPIASGKVASSISSLILSEAHQIGQLAIQIKLQISDRVHQSRIEL